ncbi:MAG: efflux transporter, family, subunit [Gemmatimonadetes bacterium]|nr:efflux transporter, family, subunit [Gemmatimonadota bacterium]
MSNVRKVVIGVVVVGAIGGLTALAVTSKSDQGIEVRTESVQRRDLVSVVTASGKVQPKKKVDISADISGRVIQVAVEEGQWVNKGDLLIRIDPTQYEAALRRSEAAVAQARAQSAQARANQLKAQSDVRRSEQLARGQDLISPADLEQAHTQAAVSQAQFEAANFAVQQAQASVSEAREALRKTTILAPMSGRVTRKNIEEGETAIVGTMNNPGTVLLTVADLSVMEAKVKVDETDVSRVKLGDTATVRVDAFNTQTFKGTVTRIGNSAVQAAASASSDQQSVDFEVVITLTNPPAQLRPDLTATADIVTDSKHGVVSVPIIAVTTRDHEGKKFKVSEDARAAGQDTTRTHGRDEVNGVFVLENGKAKFVPVTVGITGDRYFEVTSGLRGGETVVSGTYQAIRDLEAGNPVHAAPGAPAAKGGTTPSATVKK